MDEIKYTTLEFDISAEEYDAIYQLARERGMTMQEFLEEVIEDIIINN